MPVLSLLIFIPLLGAIGTVLLPTRVAKIFALVASLIPLALCGHLLALFNTSTAAFQFEELHTWLPAIGASYHLGVDGLSLLMVALNALLTPICILASWKLTNKTRFFFALFLALEAAVTGLFLSLDMLLFYLFWEAMLIPMFLLIGIWGGENRVYATLKFFLYTFVGSVLMLVAILWLWSHTGNTFSLATWLQQAPHLTLATQNLLFLAFFAAFAVKVPMWPFHTWLPDAHVQAPTAGSVILAGVLLKLGAYGFLRINLPLLPDATHYFAPFIFTLSAIAVVYAALVAFVQTDIKKLIAYSSVSHMGLVTLGLFAGTQESLQGAYLVMLNHGIVSAGLFLAVGVIYDRFHTREITNFGGLANTMPRYAFVGMVLTLAAVALPGTNSFVGELLTLIGSWSVTQVATLAAVSGVVFGALYMLWFYRNIWFGTPSEFAEHHKAEQYDLTAREMLIFAPLIILIPVLGIAPAIAQHYVAASLQPLVTHTVRQPVVVETAPVEVPITTISETTVSTTAAISSTSPTAP